MVVGGTEVNRRNHNPLRLVPRVLRLGHLDVAQGGCLAAAAQRRGFWHASPSRRRRRRALPLPPLLLLLLPARPEHDGDDARVEAEEHRVERAHQARGDCRDQGEHRGDVHVGPRPGEQVDDHAREDAEDGHADVPEHPDCQRAPRHVSFYQQHRGGIDLGRFGARMGGGSLREPGYHQ